MKKIKFKKRYFYIMLIIALGIMTTTALNTGGGETKNKPEVENISRRLENVPEKTESGEKTPAEKNTDNTVQAAPEEDTKEETFIPILPVNGEIIKEYSNQKLVYSKTLKDYRVHNGIDIKGQILDKVCASEAGTVESVREDRLMGITVTIDHKNGVKTVYSNLSSKDMVKEGDKVKKGDVINGIGDTALCETGEEAHIHFEMTVDGNYVNPLDYII